MDFQVKFESRELAFSITIENFNFSVEQAQKSAFKEGSTKDLQEDEVDGTIQSFLILLLRSLSKSSVVEIGISFINTI